jgi:hypothetical protein
MDPTFAVNSERIRSSARDPEFIELAMIILPTGISEAIRESITPSPSDTVQRYRERTRDTTRAPRSGGSGSDHHYQ